VNNLTKKIEKEIEELQKVAEIDNSNEILAVYNWVKFHGKTKEDRSNLVAIWREFYVDMRMSGRRPKESQSIPPKISPTVSAPITGGKYEGPISPGQADKLMEEEKKSPERVKKYLAEKCNGKAISELSKYEAHKALRFLLYGEIID